MSRNEFYFLVLIFLSSLIGGCTDKSRTDKATGSVSVQIPVQSSATAYQLQVVELLGISNLKEMLGKYTRFFYAPGAVNDQLTGSSPIAHFAQSGGAFIPSDFTSIQMATIYYHMQQLAQFDEKVGAGGVNQWPRSVGLETHVNDGDSFRKNNAFYDGATDAMMFVPFTNQDLPISVNAGIIAHEHFHSLFYKIVLKAAVKNNRVLTNSASIHDDPGASSSAVTKMQKQPDSAAEKVLLYNEAYLRGINEGLADFWGWVYTEDVDFMKWSLPAFVGERSLTLNSFDVGHYQAKDYITSRIEDFQQNSSSVHDAILGYSYTIGTPHARFLKMLATISANENKISVSQAKVNVAQDVILFLQSMKQTMESLKDGDMIDAGSLFQFMADQKVKNRTLTDDSCQFILSYLNFSSDKKATMKCDHQDNQVVFAEVK